MDENYTENRHTRFPKLLARTKGLSTYNCLYCGETLAFSDNKDTQLNSDLNSLEKKINLLL
jgi:hypothetical protein|tara:strand:- start:3248 stop:3430 length:183 start_codon:yes stop_codon:yes gene_type:complete